MEAALLAMSAIVAVGILTVLRARRSGRRDAVEREVRRRRRRAYARAWDWIYGPQRKRLTYYAPEPIDLPIAGEFAEPQTPLRPSLRARARFAPRAKRPTLKRSPRQPVFRRPKAPRR